MAESNLDMIVRTIREGGNVTDDAIDELKEFDKGLSNIEKTMAGTRTTIGKLDESMTVMGKNVGSTTELMNGLGMNIPISAMELFGKAIKGGIEYTKYSIEIYSDYVDQISIMAAYTNTTTEEMSKLFQITDDLRIPLESVEMALKYMTQNGVAPSIEGLANLADQYNALDDPVARSQFLLESFGRAGQDMARIMELGSEAIRDNADSIEEWMIVTGKSEEAVMEYKAAQDRMEEATMRVQYQWASTVIPGWTKLMTAILDTNDEIRTSEASWMRYAGILSAVQTVVVGLKNVFQEFIIPSPPDGAATGGGRAGGGPVFPGYEYDVGERTKERFVPSVPGYIVPGGGGGGGSVTINVYSDGIVGTTDELTQRLTPVIYDAMRQIQGAGGM
jgi:hypothetical protein